ncbi:hypothetical protein BP6252_07302 [Coleophoma cylindrospora]|uniref:Uncharacterized protein n=1 Tax=Coleophoma cylindrospora TaxID=1849047 RepID=A0A3D8RH66_9HELO|nr:hypothetical protein BP6252_07302 [Coleophoma cylindrospora]
MYLLRGSFAVLSLSLLVPLVNSRALFNAREYNASFIENFDSEDSVQLPKESFGLKPRAAPFGLCRACCTFDDSRGPSISERDLFESELEGNSSRPSGLFKRTLAPAPGSEADADTFLLNVFNKGASGKDPLTEVYSSADGVSSSSKFIDLTKQKTIVNLGVQNLCGCSILVVVSQEAVYFAHYFEDLAFSAPDVDSDDEGTPEPPDFQGQVINFLDNGLARVKFKNRAHYPGLTPNAASFQTNVQVFIVTPQGEQPGLPLGQTIYIDNSMEYNDRIIELKNKVVQILSHVPGLDTRVNIFTYQALDAGPVGGPETAGLRTLFSTSKGKSLYQFDPNESATQKSARLFIEGTSTADGRITFGLAYSDTWDKPGVGNALLARQTPPRDWLTCGDQVYDDKAVIFYCLCFGRKLTGEDSTPVMMEIYYARSSITPQLFLVETLVTFHPNIRACDGKQVFPRLSCGGQLYSPNMHTCRDGKTLYPITDDNPPYGYYPPPPPSCEDSETVSYPSSTSAPRPTSSLSTTRSSQGGDVVCNGTTFLLDSQSTIVDEGKTVIIGLSTIVIGTQTIPLPRASSGPIVISTDGIVLTVEPAPASAITPSHGTTSSVLTTTDSSTSTIIPGSPLSSTLRTSSHMVTTPISSTSTVIPGSSVSTTARSSSGFPNTQLVLGGSTFTLGPESSTVTLDGTAVVIDPSAIIVGTDTISLPESQTGPFEITTDGITISALPKPLTLTSPSSKISISISSPSLHSTESGSLSSASSVSSSTQAQNSESLSSASRNPTTTRNPASTLSTSKRSTETRNSESTSPASQSSAKTQSPVLTPSTSSSTESHNSVSLPSTSRSSTESQNSVSPSSTSSSTEASNSVSSSSASSSIKTQNSVSTISTSPSSTDTQSSASVPSSSSSLETQISVSTGSASPGSTRTQTSASPTTLPVSAATITVETIVASNGQSTIEFTFLPTTLSQFSGITSPTTIITTESGIDTTLVVGSGGVVWTCPGCDITESGFPSISFPMQPPNVGTPISTSSGSSNPFPSSQFSLPPIVTTVVTSSGPNGPILITKSGTTNSAGVVVSISTLGTAGAVSSARGLVSEINSLESIVSAFSANPTDSASASAASMAVENTNSDSNSFGRDLGAALAGLCLVFCSSVSSAASLLGELEVAVDGIIAGTIGVASLTAILSSLAGVADELLGEAEEEENSISSSSHTKTTTSTSSSSTSCITSAVTITDCDILCSTGFVADIATTSCYSTTCSAVTISACSTSASASTETGFEGGFCPLSRPPSGPISIFSYPGFTYVPNTNDCEGNGCNLLTTSTSTSKTSSASTTSSTTSSKTPSTTSSATTSTSTPGCGRAQSCELNNCNGTVTDGVATCQNAFPGCTCIPNSTTPGFCGKSQSCELNNCNGAVKNSVATCQDAFQGCVCTPSSATPGFCGTAKSCELNGCAGTEDSDGKATCKGNFAGCVCIGSSSTPGFCGTAKSCELNGCAGTEDSDGKATCKGNFAGCVCIGSSSTPGFCGTAKSCELNGCAGTEDSDGQATCKGNFAGCVCIGSSSTPGFCGKSQSCELNGCKGSIDTGQGTSSSATCKGNFKGCKCNASANTAGFCGPLGSCEFASCKGTINSNGNLGTCQGGTHIGCSCVPDANTPGFCTSDQTCDASNCAGTPNGPNTQIGTCQSGSQVGCGCILSTGTGSGSPPPPSSSCEDDCLAMLTKKINGLPDSICTDDSSNNFIDSGNVDGFTDWFRLDSDNNCFLVLAKQSHTKGFPDGFCFQKSFIQSWITNNALGCEGGEQFFRPSPTMTDGDSLAGLGLVCLSNFDNYQKCGSSTMNGGTDFGP